MCWERSEKGKDVTESPFPAFSGRCGGTDGSMGGAKHGDEGGNSQQCRQEMLAAQTWGGGGVGEQQRIDFMLWRGS